MDFCGFTKSSDDLDLRQNRLTGQIPASLGKLEALKVPRFFGRLVLLDLLRCHVGSERINGDRING